MSAPKPSLGFDSRTAAVKAMRAEGKSTAVIAAMIGISTKNVLALEASSGRCRNDVKRMSGKAAEVAFNPEVRSALRPYAAIRDITVDGLIHLLLEKIASDRLVDAVLDDEGVKYS